MIEKQLVRLASKTLDNSNIAIINFQKEPWKVMSRNFGMTFILENDDKNRALYFSACISTTDSLC